MVQRVEPLRVRRLGLAVELSGPFVLRVVPGRGERGALWHTQVMSRAMLCHLLIPYIYLDTLSVSNKTSTLFVLFCSLLVNKYRLLTTFYLIHVFRLVHKALLLCIQGRRI